MIFFENKFTYLFQYIISNCFYFISFVLLILKIHFPTIVIFFCIFSDFFSEHLLEFCSNFLIFNSFNLNNIPTRNCFYSFFLLKKIFVCRTELITDNEFLIIGCYFKKLRFHIYPQAIICFSFNFSICLLLP